MNDLQIHQSYYKIIEDLQQWKNEITLKIDEKCEDFFAEINQTFNDIHYFASITSALLIGQENQLKKATTNEEIDLLEDRIDQILAEVQFLQSLLFQFNSDSIQIPHRLQLKFFNNDIRSISSLFLLNNNYRFLISRLDALQIQNSLPSIFHLTSCHNELINECVLTFDVSNLPAFLYGFDLYWNLVRHKNEFRILIPQSHISFIIGKLGETSRLLAKRYQLDQIKFFTNLCPKSDERVLFLSCQQKDLMKDCLSEIYFNIEEKNRKDPFKQTIQLYNPANLTSDDINKILLTNIDYGGLLQTKTSTIGHNSHLSHLEEDEENEDYDGEIWNEIEQWENSHDQTTENIQHEISINGNLAGVIIGTNAKRIDRIKQRTGAYVYINGETNDLKRTVIIKGIRGQVERAHAFIENLLDKHRNYKLPIKARRSQVKRKGK